MWQLGFSDLRPWCLPGRQGTVLAGRLLGIWAHRHPHFTFLHPLHWGGADGKALTLPAERAGQCRPGGLLRHQVPASPQCGQQGRARESAFLAESHLLQASELLEQFFFFLTFYWETF